ncbi:MAG: phosphoenolpyruvate carboxykinase domain-containing protein, partial [Pseudomonadales bacterium]
YWAHWLNIGEKENVKLPSIYYVNWFRKDDNGQFVWPGFGENSRVLEWVFNRCEGTAEAVETPIGNLPTLDALNFDGLALSDEAKAALLRVDIDGWLNEVPLIHEYYDKFGDRLPKALREQVRELENRLEQAKRNVA